MKISLRFTALLLVLAMLFGVMASGCGKSSVSFDESFEMTPLTASAEKNYFMYNPDRGYRTDLVVYVDDFVTVLPQNVSPS